MTSTEEIILTGIGVSPGIAIGPAWLVEVEMPPAPAYELIPAQVDGELARFSLAVETARRQVLEVKEKSATLPDTAREEINILLDAHLGMLSGSRLIRGAEKRIRESKVNAEQAVELEIADIARQFSAIEDSYIASRITDIREVGSRIIRVLLGSPFTSLASVPKDGIVLADEITPADTVMLDPSRLAGLGAVHGGAAGHTAIMARSLGLPCVLGISGLLEQARHGAIAVIDGLGGKVILNPAPHTLEVYKKEQARLLAEKDDLRDLKNQKAVTSDGVQITLRANLELPREIENVFEAGAEGVGLMRTEFLYMNRETLPTEDEQYEILADIVSRMNGHPVTVRTLDIGGDKMVKSLGAHMGHEANPALGLRAIRLSLREPALLKSQFAAILRAGVLGPVRILLPLVTTAEEVVSARALLVETAEELRAKKAAIVDPLPPLGVMIEIPAAALAADSIAEVADFFALGTNDLIQYTVAIDRGNDLVAPLYDPLNPAVLRLLEFTAEAARRAGIPVSICGEMGADTRYTGLLLGLGVTEFSMGPASLPQVKRRVRQISLDSAKRHAQVIMDQNDSRLIRGLIEDFNARQ